MLCASQPGDEGKAGRKEDVTGEQWANLTSVGHTVTATLQYAQKSDRTPFFWGETARTAWNELPFMTWLHMKSISTGKVFECSGTVQFNVVLTALHCLIDEGHVRENAQKIRPKVQAINGMTNKRVTEYGNDLFPLANIRVSTQRVLHHPSHQRTLHRTPAHVR